MQDVNKPIKHLSSLPLFHQHLETGSRELALKVHLILGPLDFFL